MNRKALNALAVDLLIGDGEWTTEMSGGDWHYMTCLTCGASLANVMSDDPDLRHNEGCRRKLFFDVARELGLVK